MSTSLANPPAEAIATGGVNIWVSGKSATEVAGISYPRLRKLAEDNLVRARRVPGAYPKYWLPDLLALGQSA